MMLKKVLVILILVCSVNLFSQIKLNQDSINIYFQQILNDYRKSYDLPTMNIAKSYNSFTDSWSKYMLIHNYCGHGEGNNTFENRIKRFDTINLNKYYLENCAGPWDFLGKLPTKPEDPKYSYYTKHILTEDGRKVSYGYQLTVKEILQLSKVEDDISNNLNVNINMAWYIFYLWKNSPEHNYGLLDPKTTKFQVSVCISGTKMCASYLASN